MDGKSNRFICWIWLGFPGEDLDIQGVGGYFFFPGFPDAKEGHFSPLVRKPE